MVSWGALLGTLACEHGPRSLAELAPPVIAWEHDQGLCDRTRAVDGRRQLWEDGGCEDGAVSLSILRTLNEEAYAALQAAVDGLPAPDATATGASCRGSVHTFSVLSKDDTRLWTLCGLSQPDHLAGLSEPFLSLARLLNQY